MMSFILDLVEQELEIDTEKVSEDLNHLQKKISNHKSTRDTAKFIYVLICNFTAINKILFVHNSKCLILQGQNINDSACIIRLGSMSLMTRLNSEEPTSLSSSQF